METIYKTTDTRLSATALETAISMIIEELKCKPEYIIVEVSIEDIFTRIELLKHRNQRKIPLTFCCKRQLLPYNWISKGFKDNIKCIIFSQPK